jgi:hypothetical protein
LAICYEFITIVVPIKAIHQRYAGGWQKFLDRYEELFGLTVTKDENLIGISVMNSYDADSEIEFLTSQGLIQNEINASGELVAKDICIVYAPFMNTQYPCE